MLNQNRIDVLIKKAKEQEGAVRHLHNNVQFDKRGNPTEAWLMQYDYEVAIRDGLYMRIGDLVFNQEMHKV